MQSETVGVEVEYVSAPREYEELLHAEEDPAPSAGGLGFTGGLGFVSAGASGGGLGSESEFSVHLHASGHVNSLHMRS